MSMSKIHLAFIALISAIILVACRSLSDTDQHICSYFQDGERTVGSLIPDSILSIIMGSKKVECRLISRNPADTLRSDTIAQLPKEIIPVARFLFLNEDNFLTDKIIYGHFDTWATYTFISSKKKTVNLNLDFGIKKWRLNNREGGRILEGDLADNELFLSFTRTLFPADMTLSILKRNYKSSIK